MEQQKAEITIRTKDGMSYSYVNVKSVSVTPYDYVIHHVNGSQRMINRQGVIDIVVAPDSAEKVTDMDAVGSA